VAGWKLRVELRHASNFLSLGGAEVVRGFRRDSGLGRKLWSLQNEVWIPLPWGNDLEKGIKAMLRENLKVAPFFDVGGLYDPVNTNSGHSKWCRSRTTIYLLANNFQN
jgi:hemolysin activation/secretion protein